MLPTLKGKHNPGDRPRRGNKNLGSALIKSRNKAKIKFKKDFEKYRAERKEVNQKVKLESTTKRTDLGEFLYKAELEGRQFDGQKKSRLLIEEGNKLRVVDVGNFKNTRVMDKQMAMEQIEMNSKLMKIPRKPDWWGKNGEEQRLSENKAFLDWRAKLSELNDRFRGSLSPYEKNLDVWRQLWYVVDRSDLLVQVVDARDPDFFRCLDLEAYVKEKGREDLSRKLTMSQPNQVSRLISTKSNFLILNKADLVPEKAREMWSALMRKKGIDHVFFSAKLEQEDICELEELALKEEKERFMKMNQIEEEVYTEISKRNLNQQNKEKKDEKILVDIEVEQRMKDKLEKDELEQKKEEPEFDKEYIKGFLNSSQVIKRKELVALFRILKSKIIMKYSEIDSQLVPKKEFQEKNFKFSKPLLTIGMVGFPNVGKSSLINSLCEKKKVGVDCKPGKTKNYQTIVLDPSITLCDCPGLVFPSLAASKAEMVCKGVLPINNISGFVDPISYMLEHCDYFQFSNHYFLPNTMNGKTFWRPSAQEVLQFYAASRGYTAGSGIPDENKSSKLILRDLIDGKIVNFKLPNEKFEFDFGGLTQKEYLDTCYQEMSEKREFITFDQVSRTFKNIDRNDLAIINEQVRETAGEEDIHTHNQASEFEEMMDMIGPDQIEQLMEGKKVGPFKLNKNQRRELKFAIQGGMGFDELEKMFRGFVQKSSKGKDLAFGVKGKKGKKNRKKNKRR